MKDGQKKRNMVGRKVVQFRGFSPRDKKQFFLELQEAINKGYEVAQNFRMDDPCEIGGSGYVVLYKDGLEFLEDIETPDSEKIEDAVQAPDQAEVPEKKVQEGENVEEDKLVFDGLTKKVELLSFAKQEGIEIPEKLKTVPVIKKFIKDAIAK